MDFIITIDKYTNKNCNQLNTIITNSVSLIHLFKANAESILKTSFEKVIISKKVYQETVISGKKKGYSDAFRIEKAIGDFIEVEDLETKYKSYAHKLQAMGLGPGEAETIALAKQLKVPAILDEKSARKAADYSGIEYFGTFYLIYRAAEKKPIPPKEAKLTVQKLIANGFRISSELYIEFDKLIDELDS